VLKIASDYFQVRLVGISTLRNARELSNIGWQPPPKNLVKLNTHGACKDE